MSWTARLAAALVTLPLLTVVPTAHAASPIDLTSGFYVNPTSSPAVWARNNPGGARAARIQSSIG